jgi:hypothetical protein
MILTNLDFCYKGNRNYIHGTDVYNTITSYLEKNTYQYDNLDLSFHKIAVNNITLTDKMPIENDIKFVFKYMTPDGGKMVVYGIENQQEVICRYPYPEEDICNLSELDILQKEVKLTQNSSYTFIENCVALNKYLLENLFQNAEGKWYFTRLQLKIIPKDIFYPLKLKFKINFNLKLTKTEIFIDNKTIGYIYFSILQ